MCMNSINFVYYNNLKNTMRTNIYIENSLINKAKKLSKVKTKKEIVNLALESYIKSLNKKKLLELAGKVKWEGNLKQMRSK